MRPYFPSICMQRSPSFNVREVLHPSFGIVSLVYELLSLFFFSSIVYYYTLPSYLSLISLLSCIHVVILLLRVSRLTDYISSRLLVLVAPHLSLHPVSLCSDHSSAGKYLVWCHVLSSADPLLHSSLECLSSASVPMLPRHKLLNSAQ